MKRPSLITLIAFSLVFAYWATRLANLTLLPIFNDEAQYLHWVLLMKQDASNLWVSLKADNNKPLFFWLIALTSKYFDDPLLAGRSVSVAAGFFSMIGIYSIVGRLHSQWAGLVAVLFYIVSPWNMFFDRIAHKASLLNCFFIWMVWFSIKMLYDGKTFAKKYLLPMAGTIGLSLLTESTAILFVFIPLLFKVVYLKDGDLPNWRSLMSIALAGVMMGGFPYIYLYLTDTSFHVNNIFIPNVHGLSKHDTASLMLGMPGTARDSVKDVMSYFVAYSTWPVIIMAVGWFVANLKNFNKSFFAMMAFFILPLMVLMGTTGRGYSRYYLFCSTPILICGALGFADIAGFLNKALGRKGVFSAAMFVVSALVLYPSAKFDYQILTRPQSSGLVDSDRYQYVTGEFSGYGIPEAIAYFKRGSKDKKIIIFTTQNWGNPEDAMYVYLSGHPNIDVYMAPWVIDSPILPPDAKAFKIFQKYTGKYLKTVSIGDWGDVYFVCKTTTCPREIFLSNNPNFRLVEVFGKPDGTHFFEAYKSVMANS